MERRHEGSSRGLLEFLEWTGLKLEFEGSPSRHTGRLLNDTPCFTFLDASKNANEETSLFTSPRFGARRESLLTRREEILNFHTFKIIFSFPRADKNTDSEKIVAYLSRDIVLRREEQQVGLTSKKSCHGIFTRSPWTMENIWSEIKRCE